MVMLWWICIKIDFIDPKKNQNESNDPRIVPFIHKYCNLDLIVILPDLVLRNYQKFLQICNGSKNISYITKGFNETDMFQARSIEIYLVLCKNKYTLRCLHPKEVNNSN